MEPKVFLGYHKRGLINSLICYGHEQYPFDSLDQTRIQPMVFTEYANKGIAILLGFGKAMQYLLGFKKYDMEPKLFLGYLEKGIAKSLNILLYELEYNMH